MAREIELKAKISSPDELASKVSGFAVFHEKYEKEDAYWRPDEPEQTQGRSAYGVRLRRETSTDAKGETRKINYVTWKQKDVRDGIEFNNEKEFEVSSAPVFQEFLTSLGFRETNSKVKKGSAYLFDNMTIEISEVKKLGWYIELEILLPDTDIPDVKSETQARDKLLLTLDRLGIEREAVESRPYSQMLQTLSSE